MSSADLDKLLGDLTLAKLQKIFEQVMKRQEDKIDKVRSNFGVIRKEPVSLEAKNRFGNGVRQKAQTVQFPADTGKTRRSPGDSRNFSCNFRTDENRQNKFNSRTYF